MPNKCAVGGCTSNYKHKRGIVFHSFPRDECLRKKWVSLCNAYHTINPVFARICSHHFQESDYKRFLKYELLDRPVPKHLKTLKAGTVPTLHLPAPKDHPAEVMKPPHVDVQVVEVKEEPTWTEEAHDMLQQDPLALNPEPVSWQFSDSQEEPQPQGRVIYLKEEIDIKEEDVDSFTMEEVAECVTDRGGSLLQGPQEETEKLPVKRRKAMKAEV